MDQVISAISELNEYKNMIKKWCTVNRIYQPKISNYQINKISQLYQDFLQRSETRQILVSLNKALRRPTWIQNELILFQWTVVALSLSRNILLKNFEQPEYKILSSIFCQKDLYTISYQIKYMIVKGKQIRTVWKSQEEELLIQIVEKINDKNCWNQIARQLYKESKGKYFRQGKHCRQRWYNQILSQIIWDPKDDLQLLRFIIKKGKKWNQFLKNNQNLQLKSIIKKRYQKLLKQVIDQQIICKNEQQIINHLLKDRCNSLGIKISEIENILCQYKKKIDFSLFQQKQNQNQSNIEFSIKPSNNKIKLIIKINDNENISNQLNIQQNKKLSIIQDESQEKMHHSTQNMEFPFNSPQFQNFDYFNSSFGNFYGWGMMQPNFFYYPENMNENISYGNGMYDMIRQQTMYFQLRNLQYFETTK